MIYHHTLGLVESSWAKLSYAQFLPSRERTLSDPRNVQYKAFTLDIYEVFFI